MNLIDLHALAEATAAEENRMAVLVLEDALHEASWFTPENARRVYDVLLPRLRTSEHWPSREGACEWFWMGFRAAEICEVSLSLHGRRFLNAVVRVLNEQILGDPPGPA